MCGRHKNGTYFFFILVGFVVILTNVYVALTLQKAQRGAVVPGRHHPAPTAGDDAQDDGSSAVDGSGSGGGDAGGSSSGSDNGEGALPLPPEGGGAAVVGGGGGDGNGGAADDDQQPQPNAADDDDRDDKEYQKKRKERRRQRKREAEKKKRKHHHHEDGDAKPPEGDAQPSDSPQAGDAGATDGGNHHHHHGHRPRHSHKPGHRHKHHDDDAGGDSKDKKEGGDDGSGGGGDPEKPPEKHHHHHRKKKGGGGGGRSKEEIAVKRQAFHVPSIGFSEMSYEDAVAAYQKYMATDIGIRINQSSISFIDIVEDKHAGIKLPDTPIVSKRFDAVESDDPRCDPRENRLTAEVDDACRSYLQDPANWESIKPMSSILSTGRTIKFKVFLRNGAAAVMKVPQNKFVLEPSSEVEAFQTDRLLGLFRVPPVAWVSFPLKYLQAACASKKIPPARQLEGSTSPLAHDAFYSLWFQKFVVEYKQAMAAIHTDRETKERMLYVSLQLWMSDVHNTDETALNPPPQYRKLLDAGKPFPDDATNWTKVATAELSDVSLFDFVIGNTDRWFGHNSFTFGGCNVGGETAPRAKCWVDADKAAYGEPKYAFIDQGSSFYKSGPPDQVLYYGGSKEKPTASNLCRFRKSTAEAIMKLASPTEHGDLDYYASMVKQLPKGVFNVANKYLAKAARTRLEHLAKMIHSCLERHTKEQVLFF